MHESNEQLFMASVETIRVKCGGFCPTCPYWKHCREESEEERNG